MEISVRDWALAMTMIEKPLHEFEKEFSVREVRSHVSETGVFKVQEIYTIDWAWAGLYADALDRLSSNEEDE
jgi:hypothetical protein